MTTKRWKVDVYEQGSRRNVMLRDDRCETTMEIDRDGDLLVEFEVDSESYGGGSRTVRAYYPVERVIEFLREAGHPVASRSSSGSGEREALEAAAKSLEWIANRRASSAEQRAIADVLFEVRAYAESRAIVARRALSASSTDASGLREAAHEALDVLEGDFGHADAPFFHATSRAMTVLRRALSSGSPSPATGDET